MSSLSAAPAGPSMPVRRTYVHVAATGRVHEGRAPKVALGLQEGGGGLDQALHLSQIALEGCTVDRPVLSRARRDLRSGRRRGGLLLHAASGSSQPSGQTPRHKAMGAVLCMLTLASASSASFLALASTSAC
jgi:hypothetical protein